MPFWKMFLKSKDEVAENLGLNPVQEYNINIYNPTPDNQYSYNNDDVVVVVTPTPEIKINENIDVYKLGYSYYYPDLGGVNCHSNNWDEENFRCSDITASGKSWRENMYRGVALHYDMLRDIPFGTNIKVVSPEEIKGWYEVIDICPGCGPRYEGQTYFIDFLDDRQRLAWGQEVIIEIEKSE